MTQTTKARSKHSRTASCLFEILFLTLDGRYLVGDQRDLAGDIQKAEADESELAEEDVDEDSEGRENLDMEVREGVASSLGDFSKKGSLDGELNSLHTVASRNPISEQAHLRTPSRRASQH